MLLTQPYVRATKHYTAETVDWMAVYDATTDRCFYVPAQALGTGRGELRLRLRPARNNQQARVRRAEDYCDLTTAAKSFGELDFEALGP